MYFVFTPSTESRKLLAFRLTPSNMDDRKPIPIMPLYLFGKLFGAKGYISQSLFDELFQHQLQLITSIRHNMKNRLMPFTDKLLLRKRGLIETINDQLKNISQVDHFKHRNQTNFLVNLIAYPLKPNSRYLFAL